MFHPIPVSHRTRAILAALAPVAAVLSMAGVVALAMLVKRYG